MRNANVDHNEWPISNLGSVVKFISGGTPKKDEERYWNGSIPWVSSGEMSKGRIYNTQLNVTEDGVRNGTKLAPKNTIFVVVRGMSLAKEFRVSLAMREMTFNQDVKAIYPSPTIDPIFLFYYLKSQSNPIRDSASEAAHGTKKLDMPVLEQWPVPLPPLQTQNKIAAILSAYDDLIENNKRRIALLENMAEEIYREWFVRFRFPGYQQAEFEKGIPKGWEESRLDGFCEKVTDGTHDTPKPVDSGRFLVTGKNIKNRQIDFNGAYYISENDHKEISKRSGLKKWDILYSNIGTIGQTAIVSENPDYSVKNVIIFRPKSDQDSLFLFHVLKNPAISEQLLAMSSGASQQFIGLGTARGFKILRPIQSLIDMFGEAVVNLYKQINKLIAMNEALDSSKNMLLPRLISGKLSVEDLDIQFPPSMQSAAEVN